MYNQITANKRKTWLLIAIFIAIIIGLGYVIDLYMASNGSLLVIAVAISIAMSLFGYFGGDKVALASSGAHAITTSDNPYLYRMVENLSITTGLPMPKLYIINDPAINAFATGRDPQHASIAVTTGAISKLENEELEGVLAHELSHIKNYDIRVMTIVIVLVGVISILGDFFLRGQLFGRSNNNERSGNGILLVFGIIAIILAPIAAQLIQLAISRRREYLADASASLVTRYPEGLARALEKIKLESRPLQHASTATAHLYIANPFGGARKFLGNAFATHPPIEDRINKLRAM